MERLAAHGSGMLYFFVRGRAPWLGRTLPPAPHPGGFVFLAGGGLSGVTILLALRRPRLALALLLAALLGWGLEWGGKLAVGRPRPHLQGALAEPPDQPSFPSGHALGSTAVYGSLGLLLARALGRR